MENTLKERLFISRILIEEFSRQALELDPYDEKISEIIRRACMTKLKMQMFFFRYGEPIELLDQIEQMNNVIKKLEDIQTKRRL